MTLSELEYALKEMRRIGCEDYTRVVVWDGTDDGYGQIMEVRKCDSTSGREIEIMVGSKVENK